MQRLKDILSYRRPNESEGEWQFIKNYLWEATPYVDEHDEVLAYVIDVADKDNVVPPVLWCCHIDTVHNTYNDAIWQEVSYDSGIGMMFRPKDSQDCLGADDGAGVWLLLEMIDAGVPGSYIFHRGEEVGGTGSVGMADYHTDWLKRFKWAIAFDRKGDSSVITHQFGGRCCSEDFAMSFAREIRNQDARIRLEPDDSGTFTDTANYTHLIPECTNISCGYTMQHTEKEDLDVFFLEDLRDAVISAFKMGIDLPTARDPNEVEDKYEYLRYGSYGQPSYLTSGELEEGLDPNTEAEELLKLGWSALRKKLAEMTSSELTDLVTNLSETTMYLNECVTELEYEKDFELKTRRH